MFYRLLYWLNRKYIKLGRTLGRFSSKEKPLDLTMLQSMKPEDIFNLYVHQGGNVKDVESDIRRQTYRDNGRRLYHGKRVLFILPAGAVGGGANVVVSEALAMRRMGVDAVILNLSANSTGFNRDYAAFELPVVWVDGPEAITSDLCNQYNAVVATAFRTVAWLEKYTNAGNHPVLGYYIQDFEPFFETEGSAEYLEAIASYSRIKGIRRFTKTDWTRNLLLERLGCDSRVVHPSFDCDLFFKRPPLGPEWPQRKPRVVVMIRPDTPRRNPEGTVRILKKLCSKYPDRFEVLVFGIGSRDPAWLKLRPDLNWKNAGVLNPLQMSVLLNETDIFCDFSHYQAMGLTAMEAMACKVAVIAPQSGGSESFVNNGHNAMLVDTSSEDACIEVLEKVLLDDELRVNLQQNGAVSISDCCPERSAFCILQELFGE